MKKRGIIIILLIGLISCGSNEPKPIKLNFDSCDFCKMTISNSIFASEAITEKGRVYKFDDASCMIKYIKSNDAIVYKSLYVNDYTTPHKMILVEKGFFLKGGAISAPMGGNIAAFSNDEIRKVFLAKLKAQLLTWDEIYKSY